MDDESRRLIVAGMMRAGAPRDVIAGSLGVDEDRVIGDVDWLNDNMQSVLPHIDGDDLNMRRMMDHAARMTFLRAARVLIVSIASTPSASGHLFARSPFVSMLLRRAAEDAGSGMHALMTEPMAITGTVIMRSIPTGSVIRRDDVPMLIIHMRPSWQVENPNGEPTTEEKESIVAWLNAIIAGDPVAMGFVDALPMPPGIQVDEHGNITNMVPGHGEKDDGDSQ